MSEENAIGKLAAEWVPTSALQMWDRNPRDNAAAVDKVAASIQRFGFGAPIVARRADGEIIAGHTRLMAARKLGLERVPVRYLDLDPTEAHLLALADNRLGDIAEWEHDQLVVLLRNLQAEEVDLAGIGFDEKDLSILLASGATIDPGEWVGLPIHEPDSETPPLRAIKIAFNDQAAVAAFAVATGLTISDKTKFAYFPPRKTERVGVEFVEEAQP